MIEKYLDGTLGRKERKKLEDRLGKDKELADLIKMHAEVNESIRDNELHALHDKIKKISDAYFNSMDQAGKKKLGKRNEEDK